MNKTEKQKKILLDRYEKLVHDFDKWLQANVNTNRNVIKGERIEEGEPDPETMSIRFERPFLVGRHFVVNRLSYSHKYCEFMVVGGVIRDITEYVPLSSLNLAEKVDLAVNLADRGYFALG